MWKHSIFDVFYKRKSRELCLGNNLAQYMFQNNMDIEELAEKSGTTIRTVEAILYDKFIPSTRLALCLACVLDCKVDDLFFLFVDNK